MSWRTTLILLILAAGLGMYVYFTEAPPAETDSNKPLFPQVAESAVKAISVERKDGTLRLVREEDGWAIAQPISGPAEKAEVESFLRAFLALRSEKEIQSEDVSEFGLDAPPLTIRTEGDGPEAAQVLTIGKETPWRGGRYARTDRSGIVAVSAHLAERADAPVVNFRRRELVPIPFDAVTGFSAKSAGGSLACRKEADGTWWIEEPQKGLAGADEVSEYVNALKRLRAESFADDAPTPEALKKYGLAPDDPKNAPAVTVALHRKDKDPLTVWFGRPVSEEAFGTPPRYARVSDHPFVYTVRAKDEEVTRKPLDLRADRILALEGKHVNEISIERAEEPLFLRKEGEKWVFTKLSEADARKVPTRRADDIAVHKLVARFQELKFRDFAKAQGIDPFVVATDAAKRKQGLEPPFATLTLTHRNGTEKLRIAAPRDGRCLVLREGEGLAVWVDASIHEAAATPYRELRDRTMTDLWSDGAYQLHARYRDGREITFRKQENGQWLADGDETKSDRPAARDLARKLARLPADRILSAGGKPPREAGLSDPEATVQAFFTAAKSDEPDASCTLVVGTALPDGSRHARVEEDRFGHLFTIPRDLAEKILAELPKAPETKK